MEREKIYLQITYMIRASYQVYIRDSCNSVGKKNQTTQIFKWTEEE